MPDLRNGRHYVESGLNRLLELKAFLDMVAKTKRRGHFEIDFDGERFHWTVPVKNMTASQLASLTGLLTDSPPQLVGEHERKEHHGT